MNTRNESLKSSAVFVLYRNQKQTYFKAVQGVTIDEAKITIHRSPSEDIQISLESVAHYKVY